MSVKMEKKKEISMQKEVFISVCIARRVTAMEIIMSK